MAYEAECRLADGWRAYGVWRMACGRGVLFGGEYGYEYSGSVQRQRAVRGGLRQTEKAEQNKPGSERRRWAKEERVRGEREGEGEMVRTRTR